MSKHWTILFLENIISDLNYIVRSNAQKEIIKCCMVEFTKGYAVGDDWITTRFSIGDNMGSI